MDCAIFLYFVVNLDIWILHDDMDVHCRRRREMMGQFSLWLPDSTGAWDHRDRLLISLISLSEMETLQKMRESAGSTSHMSFIVFLEAAGVSVYT